MTFQVIPVPAVGPEDVVVATGGPYAGQVFTGTEDGSVFRITPDGAQIELVARTGGRPLGLEWLPDDRLLVCDAHRGLLAVDPGSGAVEVLLGEVGGRPMRFCNNAGVGADGTIWFSDSSTVYGIEHWKRDFVEGTCTGRLLRRDPDGSVEVLLDGLALANGVALSADESYVAVAESGRRTVVRLRLTGERAGERDLLVPELPGYPDNIALGSDGLVWVTVTSPVDPAVELLRRGPLALRRAVTRIPDRLQPQPKRTVHLQAYDDAGRLVHEPRVDTDALHMVTGVREHEGRLWLGSLLESSIAVLHL